MRSNAKAEAHNRTTKLVARNACGFANPQNQIRRVRMATTRAARQARGGAPQPVTDGSQERGGRQGTVGTAGGIRTGRAQEPDRWHPG